MHKSVHFVTYWEFSLCSNRHWFNVFYDADHGSHGHRSRKHKKSKKTKKRHTDRSVIAVLSCACSMFITVTLHMLKDHM